MSAISGLVDFTGARIGALQRDQLAQAGFGGESNSWLDHIAGLVSTSAQMLHDPEARLVLAIDGRIHGTQKLRAACAAAGHPQQGEADAELVLRAYQAWGEQCPLRILGEFACAIWDETQQRLLCVRDSAGARPLFYAVLPDGSLRFATNALQILADPDVPRSLDRAGLVDFLINRSTLLPDRSPWRSVRRLPPAHGLIYDRSGLRIARYWSVHEAPGISFSNRAESVECCAEALQAANHDRVEGEPRCGVSLSGGWDSGAVFAVLQSLRGNDPSLPEAWFYNYYGDSAEADERAEVRELLRCWPAPGEFIHLDASCGLDGLDRHCAELAMPEPASGWRWVGECAAAARAAGVTHVLTGEAGNEVFQSSIMRPADLLLSGRPRDAFRQVKAWGADAEISTGSFLLPFLIRPALAAWAPGMAPVMPSLRRAQAAFGRSSNGLSFLTDSSRELALDAISQVKTRNRRYLPGRSLSSWDKRIALERWCNDLFPMPAGPELNGVTFTAPFLDRRVVTTALAALDFESDAGSTRQLLASTVEITTGRPFRGRHAHYTELLDKMLRSELEKNSSLFDAPSLVELDLVHPKRIKVLMDGFRTRKGAALGLLWRLVSAEMWARRFIT